MILKYLSALLTSFAPAFGNHLWQSTLFAIMAGLLTLFLQRNHARTRYWLWMSASVKFLFPFSLLVGIGSHLAWSRGSAGTNAGLYLAMEVSQAFTQPTMPMISRATLPTVSTSLIHLLPVLLTAVWLCGFVVVLCLWYVRWRRISAVAREALPLLEGREVETLRRLERIGGIRKRIEMLLSRTSLEPGIFGIVRPVLVWPQGMSERLEDAHLEAILAHELWHVRRRDNLAAAVHMLVEAIFWFYPLVWWMGARLVEERERACDEEVLELGGDRKVYAESILKICEFCVGSPLACVSGVAGADLKKRITRIMTEHVARKLDFGRKVLLSAAGLVAVAAPVVFGLLHASQTRAESLPQNTAAIAPGFGVVSIKPTSIKPDKSGRATSKMISHPGEFTAMNVTLQAVIRSAYGVEDDRISGGPNWLNSEKYDIDAKTEKSVKDELEKLSPDQHILEWRRMLQALLANHFKLALHRESRELPVYVLVIANDGPKLQEAKPGDTYPNGVKGLDSLPAGAGRVFIMGGGGPVIGQGIPIASLVGLLSGQLNGRTILDKTGLTGKYDFTLQWAPDESHATMFTAIQEQLGLKLESQTVPVEILVIDHAEQPSEN